MCYLPCVHRSSSWTVCISVRRLITYAACWKSIKHNQRLCIANKALLSLHTWTFVLQRKSDRLSGKRKNNGKNIMRDIFSLFTSNFLNIFYLSCCRLTQRGSPGGLQPTGPSAWSAAPERTPILGFGTSQSPPRRGSTGEGGQESGQSAESHWRWIQCHSSPQSGKRRNGATDPHAFGHVCVRVQRIIHTLTVCSKTSCGCSDLFYRLVLTPRSV